MSTTRARPKQRQMIILGSLVVVMLGLMIRVLYKPAPPQAQASQSPAMPASGAGTGSPPAARPALPRVVVNWAAEASRDPFDLTKALGSPGCVPAPPVHTGEATPAPTRQQQDQDLRKAALDQLQVQATLLGNRPQALINGQTWQIGQVIQGFTLRAIHSRSVVVEKDGIQITINM